MKSCLYTVLQVSDQKNHCVERGLPPLKDLPDKGFGPEGTVRRHR